MELKQYLSELEYLVNIDSGPGCVKGQMQVAKFFSDRFEEMGWTVKSHTPEPDAGPCVICTNHSAQQYDLMLIGHLDTVFPLGTAAKRPFKIEGRRAYGPGVYDMKQGSLLIYYIIKELPKAALEKLNIAVVFNPDEEVGSIYSQKIYAEIAKETRYAYIYEGASSDMARCVERKGAIRFTAKFSGKSGHCGFVFTNGARSAVSEMARWIVKLDSLQSEERGTSVNVGVARGGLKSNVVPDSAQIEVDIRILKNSERQKIENTLSELMNEASEHQIGVTIENKKETPALVPTDEGRAYIKHVEEIAKSIGIDYHYRLRGGMSDGNKIAGYGAICIDAMGPAGGDDHSPDEYMLIDSVVPSIKLSVALIEDLANNK